MRESTTAPMSLLAQVFQTAPEKKSGTIRQVAVVGKSTLSFELDSDPGVTYFAPLPEGAHELSRTAVGHAVTFTLKRVGKTVRGFKNLSISQHAAQSESSPNAGSSDSDREKAEMWKCLRELAYVVAVSAFALAALAAYPVYVTYHGYQSEQLSKLSTPIVSAMKEHKLDRLECDLLGEIWVTVGDFRAKIRKSPRYICPTMNRLDIRSDDTSRILSNVTFRSTRELESDLKRVEPSIRKSEFDYLATVLRDNAGDIKQQIAARAEFEEWSKTQEANAKVSWQAEER